MAIRFCRHMLAWDLDVGVVFFCCLSESNSAVGELPCHKQAVSLWEVLLFSEWERF